MADEAEESGKKILVLRSSDGEDFEVEEDVATESVAIDHMVQDDCADDVIPLPNVSSRILCKVLDYCTKHVQLRSAIADEAAAAAKAAAVKADAPAMTATKELSTFDANFVDVDHATLCALMEAANYLEIKELMDLTCKTVANMIKGKTTEQIRQTFHITNDFTPEEEAKFRKDNQWAFE